MPSVTVIVESTDGETRTVEGVFLSGKAKLNEARYTFGGKLDIEEDDWDKYTILAGDNASADPVDLSLTAGDAGIDKGDTVYVKYNGASTPAAEEEEDADADEPEPVADADADEPEPDADADEPDADADEPDELDDGDDTEPEDVASEEVDEPEPEPEAEAVARQDTDEDEDEDEEEEEDEYEAPRRQERAQISAMSRKVVELRARMKEVRQEAERTRDERRAKRESERKRKEADDESRESRELSDSGNLIAEALNAKYPVKSLTLLSREYRVASPAWLAVRKAMHDFVEDIDIQEEGAYAAARERASSVVSDFTPFDEEEREPEPDLMSDVGSDDVDDDSGEE